MRADGRPSGSTVASVIAWAFRMDANASRIQLSRSSSGLSGRGSGSGGCTSRPPSPPRYAQGTGDAQRFRNVVSDVGRRLFAPKLPRG